MDSRSIRHRPRNYEGITDELQEKEDRVIKTFQETSPSVVFIEDLELVKSPSSGGASDITVDETAKIEGTGLGFVWVTNYRVVVKLATDRFTVPYLIVYGLPYKDRF